MDPPPSDRQPTRPVQATQIDTSTHAPAPQAVPCQLVVEAPLTVDVQDVASYTIMATPTDDAALAVGFLFSEGIIASMDDVLLLQRCEDDPGVIRVRLAGSAQPGSARRNLVVVSACGLCGSENIDDVIAGLPTVGEQLVVRADVLRMAVEAMHAQQTLFKQTGGAHAAALFGADGALVAFAEDIGRHNALDKVIGQRLLQGCPPRGLGVALSGRVSLEMVAKCARAGIEVIAAVSAPTSLALQAAERGHITLCAFVRANRATVYCQPQRILDLP